MPSLPYVDAIYREVLRGPVATIASFGCSANAPHSLTEDDYYKGYFIPKGRSSKGRDRGAGAKVKKQRRHLVRGTIFTASSLGYFS
ncbi:hypothetical protein BJ912DRAFT_946979 [Pholiota molesta]|nr:hypothetical protein BJ912DRAFT_946979 [Pholiota molesta]